MADVKRAKDEAQDEAVISALAVVFTALMDKHGWTAEQLQTLWGQVMDLADSVGAKRVSIADLLCVLKEEYGVVLQ